LIQPQVLLGDLLPINLGESIQLTPTAFGMPPMTWSWAGNQGEMSCRNCQSPIVAPLFDATYSVTMTDATGCPASASVEVLVLKNRNVFVPNAFSPNGDGINDFFFLQSPQAAFVKNFKVFSRWGELVFETTQAAANEHIAGWDGYFKGKQAPLDVYVWMLEVEFLDGETASFKGDVTLVR